MNLAPGTLVLYKQKPARVTGVSADKIDLETPAGTARVRPKDVVALHPGPVPSLSGLDAPPVDPADVWALMDGESLPLADVAELAFGRHTPAAALAVWAWTQDGTYFTGTPERITPRARQHVEAAHAAQRAREEEAHAWTAFVQALHEGRVTDPRRLAEVEQLALGRTQKSRVLAALGRPETPEEAHALLLRVGAWTSTRNPHPVRYAVDMTPPALSVPPLPEEDRLDLTHLEAFAIDDEGSSDPDDAISLETRGDGYRLWVHVADVAALVPSGSELDVEARRRGATLYLPDVTVPMLPDSLTHALGLGLTDVSPALSFAIDLTRDFEPEDAHVHVTRVRVTRLTYASAQEQLHEPHLQDLARAASALRARREAAGAVMLDLPEVRVRVTDGRVHVTPLPPLRSRVVVQEAMMLAGWAAATSATREGVALPFAAQDPPLTRVNGDTLPDHWARRKSLARTRFSPAPGRHAGLGLDVYAQATSPMRRYLDLVVHQQLRAMLDETRPLSGQDIAARAAEADMNAGGVRQAERASNRHWLLNHLLQHPEWTGEGVVVDRRGSVATVLLPALALDVTLPIPHGLGDSVTLRNAAVNLPALETRWRVLDTA